MSNLSIKEKRKYLGMNQKDMAAAVSVSPRMYQNYEYGASETPQTVLDAIRVLVATKKNELETKINAISTHTASVSASELSDLAAPINGLQDYSAFSIMEHILLNPKKFQEDETYKLFIEKTKQEGVIEDLKSTN